MKISLDAKDIFNKLIEDSQIKIYLDQIKIYHTQTYNHSLNVGLLCIEISLRKNFSNKEIIISGISGLLHDIGKIYIPLEILSKKESLTDQEKKIIKLHPRYSYNILETFFIPEVKKIVISHHEFDIFSSYPRKNIFSQNSNRDSSSIIEEISQIVAIADVYDALSSSRSYKDEFSENEIFDIMFSQNFTWNEELVLEVLK